MDIKKRMQNGEAGAIKAPDQIVRERLRLELIKNRERANKRIKDVNRKRHTKNVKRKQKKWWDAKYEIEMLLISSIIL